MNDMKQWYVSKTVWGGLIAILASLMQAAASSSIRRSKATWPTMLWRSPGRSAASSRFTAG